MKWMIGTYPVFMYCAVCGKTVFYPLAKLLTGTNMCSHCNHTILRFARRLWSEIKGLFLPLHRHSHILVGAIISNDLEQPIELTWGCTKCSHFYRTLTNPYTWFNSDRPANLWEAIHFHIYEVVAMTYERSRLRKADDWELSDILRNEINRWDFSVADIPKLPDYPKGCTLIKRYEQWEKIPDRKVEIEKLMNLCQSRQWKLQEVTNG